jgi:hypothetical protein
MPSHRGWKNDAFRRQERTWGRILRGMVVTATVGIAMLGGPASASAGDSRNPATPDGVDTEHLFGFTEGTNIGAVGDKDVEADSAFRFGKRTGLFANAASEMEFKYTAFQNFRISVAAAFAYYDISGVVGMEDRRQSTVQSTSFDARFLILDRNRSPFGLTLSVAPHWGFADETSGVRTSHRGIEFLLRADREIVSDRLFGALNLLFDTDRTRLRPGDAVEQAPTLGVGAALATQLLSGVWVGGEARYLRSYTGAALESFSGHALYMGPTLYARLGRKGWLSTAWSFQVWGEATGTAGALDLVNFERQQVKFRIGYEF